MSGGARTILAMLGLLLAGCAADPASSGTGPVSRGALTAIQRYYERNAAEENNACSALLMSITRSQLVSESEGQLFVDVAYSYSNFANRSGRRCRGVGNRRFTLSNEAGRYRVTDMTGERRLGPSWRLIDARPPVWRFS